MNYRIKQFMAIILIAVVVFTGIPLYPGGVDVWTEKAYASTNMRVEPSEINIDKGDKTTILFSFNAADGGQAEHDTVIMVCTPQANGAPPIPGSVIMQGSFKTKENEQYVTHKVEWDGTINGQPLPEGRYTLCVAPASYTGNGVYYGQMASFEIVGSERPSEPADISVKPAAVQGAALVSGTAPPSTSVGIELSETGSDEVRRAGSAQASSRGVWSYELNLPTNKLTHIAARTLQGDQASSYAQMVSVLRYSLPAFSVSWEAVASYFYKIDNTSELIEMARQIAEWNNISYNICQASGCPETITGVDSLILINPEMESVPAQADLALFRTEEISKRLRVVNPTGIAPVDPARGDFVYYAPTLRLQALMPLSFGLRYMSRQAEEGANGPGWRHAYEWSLTPVDGKMELIEPDGSRYEFIPLASGDYMTPRGTSWRLERAGSAHILYSLDGTQYRFNAQGSLQSIEDTNGNRADLSYANDLLQAITTNGASLSLSYNAQNRLTAVSDHSGRQLE